MIAWFVFGAMMLVALSVAMMPLLCKNSSREMDRDEQNIAIYRHRLQELASDAAAGVLAEEEADGAREELVHRLPRDLKGVITDNRQPSGKSRWLAAAFVVVLPLLGGAFYVTSGGMQRLHASRHEHKLESDASQLAQKLQAHPQNPQEWFLLGRIRMSLGHYSQAAAAYAQAEAHVPLPNAEILSHQAQALGMAAGADFRGQPKKLLDQALKIDPANTEALWLAGVAAQEANDYRHALAYWKRISQADLPRSFKTLLNKRIRQVRQALAANSG